MQGSKTFFIHLVFLSSKKKENFTIERIEPKGEKFKVREKNVMLTMRFKNLGRRYVSTF